MSHHALAPDPGRTSPRSIPPAAWHDGMARLHAARAVLGVLYDHVPTLPGADRLLLAQMDALGRLIDAASFCVAAAAEDLETLETEFCCERSK